MIVTIEKVVYGGYGLTREGGAVRLVFGALPGETVETANEKKSKSVIFVDTARILSPHPRRIKPPCPYFCLCGGCDLQHASYDLQLELKQAMINECADRAGVRLPPFALLPSSPFGYRNRLRVRLNGDGVPSFFKRGSRTPQPIEQCLCACETINHKLKEMTENPRPESSGEEIQLTVDSEGVCRSTAVLGFGAEAMPTFSQVNDEINEKIRTFIRQFAESERKGQKIRLLDLFCGNGNFSLPLADIAERIDGFDLNAAAIESANRSAVLLHETKIRYRRENLYHVLGKKKIADDFDFCIVDPPAAGLKAGASVLAESGLPTVVYVSCSPPDLMRDLAILTQRYEIKAAAAFDMFPQTSKIEMAVLLSKLSNCDIGKNKRFCF